MFNYRSFKIINSHQNGTDQCLTLDYKVKVTKTSRILKRRKRQVKDELNGIKACDISGPLLRVRLFIALTPGKESVERN